MSSTNQPSLHDYYAISNAAYGGTPAQTIPTGYTLLSSESDNSTGFSAQAYLNSSTGNIVIAFRGTVPGNPFSEPTSGDLIANDQALSGQYTGGQWGEAVAYVNQIATENPNFNIYLTGHSLGGLLAQWVDSQTANKISGGATFGSPEMVGLKSYSGNLVNYVNNNDPVATANLSGGTSTSVGYVGERVPIGQPQILTPITANETGTDARGVPIVIDEILEALPFLGQHLLSTYGKMLGIKGISESSVPSLSSFEELMLQANPGLLGNFMSINTGTIQYYANCYSINITSGTNSDGNPFIAILNPSNGQTTNEVAYNPDGTTIQYVLASYETVESGTDGSEVSVTGNSDTINGGNADTLTVDGTGNTATLGTGAVVTVNGDNNSLTLGNGGTITLLGTNTIFVTGDDGSLDLGTSGDTAIITGLGMVISANGDTVGTENRAGLGNLDRGMSGFSA